MIERVRRVVAIPSRSVSMVQPSSVGVEARGAGAGPHLDAAGLDVLGVGLGQRPEAAAQVAEAIAPGPAPAGALADPGDEPGHRDRIRGVAELRGHQGLPEHPIGARAEPAGPVHAHRGRVHPVPVATDELVGGAERQPEPLRRRQGPEAEDVERAVEWQRSGRGA